MFPLYDENPRLRVPLVTVAIIALNIASWIFLQGLGTKSSLAGSLCLYGLIPADLLGIAKAGTLIPIAPGLACVIDNGTPWYTLLTSMFMHGSWFHIIGNLWFLWVFGDNVEEAMGRFRFAVFYVVCGLAAAAAQVMTDTHSLAPMVGASGAIGGVMGAYARLFPKVQVHNLIFFGFFITTIALPAYLMLGYWIVLQVLGFLPALTGSVSGGVAFWAHIGGFAAGILLAGPLSQRRHLAAIASARRRLHSRHQWF